MGNQSLYSYHAKFCLRYMYWLEFFSGNPLFIAARCRFTFTYSTVRVGGTCRSFTMLQKELFVRGSPFQIRAICYAVQDLCTHVGLPFTCCKKQQARRSSARGKLESEKVGLPWAWPGVLEGTYDPCFNQIHARNIIKHSNNVSFH